MVSALSSRRAFLRAALGASTLLSAAFGLAPARGQGRPRLLVFVPADIPPTALQKQLVNAIPAADITVFGRFRDLEVALGKKPDAVLTLGPVLLAKGLRSTIAGKNAGSSTEPYVLLAIGRQVAPDRLASVGAVDLMGRQGMKELLSRLLGTMPRVERVTKYEDLLPLLQFGSAEAVLLPERLLSTFRARSKLDLQASRVRDGVGLPALAVLSPEGASLVWSVKTLALSISKQMGVQQWE